MKKVINVLNSFSIDGDYEDRPYHHIIGIDDNNVYYYLNYLEVDNFTKNDFSLKNNNNGFSVQFFSNDLDSLINGFNSTKEYYENHKYDYNVDDNDYGFKVIKISDLEYLKDKFEQYDLIK